MQNDYNHWGKLISNSDSNDYTPTYTSFYHETEYIRPLMRKSNYVGKKDFVYYKLELNMYKKISFNNRRAFISKAISILGLILI